MEPENIILGCLKITGGLELAKLPTEAYLRGGRDLTIRLPYEYRHYGKEWDGYLVTLRTTLDGETREVEARGHRHAATQGDLYSVLETKYCPLAPGEHELQFEIIACFKHGPRGRPELNSQEELLESGTVKLTAAPMLLA